MANDQQRVVLYVDDEPQNLWAFRFALEDEFSIVTAGSGDEALRTLAKQTAIAVMVTDSRMPRMSGVELCARSREIRPEVGRIITTAYADIHDAIAAINHGQVHQYVPKPYRPAEMTLLLHEQIDAAHQRLLAGDDAGLTMYFDRRLRARELLHRSSRGWQSRRSPARGRGAVEPSLGAGRRVRGAGATRRGRARYDVART